MFVSQSMTKKVITVNPEESLLAARAKLKENGIRHLPVVDENNKLLGIITDRDIRSALPPAFFAMEKKGDTKAAESEATAKVGDVMTVDPVTISPSYTIPDALLVVQNRKVGALPVVAEDGTVTGILSVRDLLRAFINVLGIGEPGTLLCILVDEKVGQLKRIVDAITEENVSFGSVLVARYWDKNKRAVFPYLLTLNVSRVKKKLTAMGFELLDPMAWYMDQLPENDE